MKKKLKNEKSMNWSTDGAGELHTSEWFGAIIRYLYHLGKRPFNTLYTEDQLQKNSIIGWIFKMVMVITGIILLLYISSAVY